MDQQYVSADAALREIMSCGSRLGHIEGLLEFVAGMYPNCVYENGFEYQFLKERWAELPEYLTAENYAALVSGLDDRSARIAARLLSRVQRILASENRPIDLFDADEMAEMFYVRHTFPHEILALRDGVFAFRGSLLPINHFEKGIFVDRHGADLLDRERFAGSALIDVGAFVGDSACVLSGLTTDRVYSFEALEENFQRLEKTIALNGLSNVVPFHMALGDVRGSAATENLYEGIANGSCCRARSVCAGAAEDADGPLVDMTTLDSFVSERGIRCGLIKVDIEGAELEFLKGARNTIVEQKPSMIVSVYHSPGDFFRIKPLLQEWVPEYRFRMFKPVDGAAVLDTVLLCECQTCE